jgi:hypothetical protein
MAREVKEPTPPPREAPRAEEGEGREGGMPAACCCELLDRRGRGEREGELRQGLLG